MAARSGFTERWHRWGTSETPWVQIANPTRSPTLVVALSVGAARSPTLVTLPIPATHDGSGVFRGPASLDQEKMPTVCPFIGEGAGEGHGSSWSEYMNDTSPADHPGDQQWHEAHHSSGRVLRSSQCLVVALASRTWMCFGGRRQAEEKNTKNPHPLGHRGTQVTFPTHAR
jgi:hypothetical protein